MAKQSPAQKDTVARVMHEFKHRELEQRGGEPVKNPKQAIAIALHEAGATNQETPVTNRANLARTKRKERRGETAEEGETKRGGPAGESRATLYAEAKRRDVPGRSRMSKAELARAVGA